MKNYFKGNEQNTQIVINPAAVAAVAATAAFGGAIGVAFAKGTVSTTRTLTRKTVAFMRKKVTEFQEKQFTVPEPEVVDECVD